MYSFILNWMFFISHDWNKMKRNDFIAWSEGCVTTLYLEKARRKGQNITNRQMWEKQSKTSLSAKMVTLDKASLKYRAEEKWIQN